MPMLPSGQHVGVDPEPFLGLMREAYLPNKIHHLFSITDWQSLWPWLDVVKFVPADSPASPEDPNLSRDSNVLPNGLILQRTGFNLSQLSNVQSDWSAEDIVAFDSFLSDRAAQHFDVHVQTALNAQQTIRDNGDAYSRTLAAWWDQGIHPAQDANWKPGEPDPVELQWDIYDAYALWGWCSRLLGHQVKSVGDLAPELASIVAKWIFLKSEWQLDMDPTSESPRQQADVWRKLGVFDGREQKKRAFLTQTAIEGVHGIWKVLPFDELQAMAPEAADLLQLIVLSTLQRENIDE